MDESAARLVGSSAITVFLLKPHRNCEVQPYANRLPSSMEISMKTLIRSLSVAAAIAAFAVTLPAQTSTIVSGRTTISSSTFLQYVASFNVTVTDLAGNPAQTNPVTFPVTEGAIDLQTGAGEITNVGGYLFRGNSNSVRVQDFVLDSTTPASPVLTALFIVDNKLVGRRPLYQVTVPSSITLPLKPQGGIEQINGLSLTLTQAAATIFNNALIITEPVLQPGTSAGTANLYTVLAPQ
jgi:hypothetical protein